MAKHSFTHYFVQFKLGDAQPKIVGHSQEKKTSETNSQFQCGNVEDGHERCKTQCEYCKRAKFE